MISMISTIPYIIAAYMAVLIITNASGMNSWRTIAVKICPLLSLIGILLPLVANLSFEANLLMCSVGIALLPAITILFGFNAGKNFISQLLFRYVPIAIIACVVIYSIPFLETL